jgi:hypothetical protein
MMISRRYALVAGAFLFVTLLSVLPASAAGQTATSCALLPWEQPATDAVSPLEQGQTQFILKTSCTTSAQCPTGQACHCGQCHAACATGYRWSCTCQVCYRCPSGYFFDDSLCACAAI